MLRVFRRYASWVRVPDCTKDIRRGQALLRESVSNPILLSVDGLRATVWYDNKGTTEWQVTNPADIQECWTMSHPVVVTELMELYKNDLLQFQCDEERKMIRLCTKDQVLLNLRAVECPQAAHRAHTEHMIHLMTRHIASSAGNRFLFRLLGEADGIRVMSILEELAKKTT